MEKGEALVTPELLAPFPWFGGKSKVSNIVWERFGNVPNYVEPFFGSGAVLLNRPHEPHAGQLGVHRVEGAWRLRFTGQWRRPRECGTRAHLVQSALPAPAGAVLALRGARVSWDNGNGRFRRGPRLVAVTTSHPAGP